MKNKLWGLLIGIVLTVFFIFPLLNKFSTSITSRQDGLLVAWLIDWGSQSIITGQNFFDAPFFYPYHNTINYSDLFFSTALLNIPIKLIQTIIDPNHSNLNNIIFNHNLHLFLGSILIFWGQYLLGLYLFKSKKIAVLSALIFNFSSMHFKYIVHLQSFLMAGIPFYFLFLFKYLKTKKAIYLTLMSIALLYQLLNSPMSGMFLIVMSLVTLINKSIRLTIRQNIKQIAPFLIGILTITSFFYWPFLQVSQQFHYTRSIRDTAHFSLSIDQLLSLEIIFYFLLISILLFFRKRKQKTAKYFWLFFSFMILGGLLMLGPVLKINDQTLKIFGFPIPLPYVFFYYLFPGFKAFRDSSRWIIVFCFGLSITLGYLVQNVELNTSINKLLSKINKHIKVNKLTEKKKKIKIINNDIFININIVVILGLLWLTQVPHLKLFSINTEIPPIYKIIKQRPETVLAEFPTYVWSQFDQYYREADRLLYQSYHHKKLYNGYSGFAPPKREILWHTISDNLGNREVVEHLKNSKVELVLLRGDENKKYQNFSSPYYQLITCQKQDCLYYLK